GLPGDPGVAVVVADGEVEDLAGGAAEQPRRTGGEPTRVEGGNFYVGPVAAGVKVGPYDQRAGGGRGGGERSGGGGGDRRGRGARGAHWQLGGRGTRGARRQVERLRRGQGRLGLRGPLLGSDAARTRDEHQRERAATKGRTATRHP